VVVGQEGGSPERRRRTAAATPRTGAPARPAPGRLQPPDARQDLQQGQHPGGTQQRDLASGGVHPVTATGERWLVHHHGGIRLLDHPGLEVIGRGQGAHPGEPAAHLPARAAQLLSDLPLRGARLGHHPAHGLGRHAGLVVLAGQHPGWLQRPALATVHAPDAEDRDLIEVFSVTFMQQGGRARPIAVLPAQSGPAAADTSARQGQPLDCTMDLLLEVSDDLRQRHDSSRERR